MHKCAKWDYGRHSYQLPILRTPLVSPGHRGIPRTPPASSGYGIPRTPLVSSGYRGVPRTPRCPQDTAGILKTRCPQDTAVSWGHRVLRTPPRVLGHGIPRIPPPVLGISRYPQDAPRVPRRQLAFSDVHNEFESRGCACGETLECTVIYTDAANRGIFVHQLWMWAWRSIRPHPQLVHGDERGTVRCLARPESSLPRHRA
jgi:hypothetical protein